jgi:hypothetical protein
MSIGDIATRVDAALREEEPVFALHAVVYSFLREGHRRAELVDALEGFRERLEAEGRDEDDDRVLDIMAVLDGWASETAVRGLMPPPCEAPQAVRLD